MQRNKPLLTASLQDRAKASRSKYTQAIMILDLWYCKGVISSKSVISSNPARVATNGWGSSGANQPACKQKKTYFKCKLCPQNSKMHRLEKSFAFHLFRPFLAVTVTCRNQYTGTCTHNALKKKRVWQLGVCFTIMLESSLWCVQWQKIRTKIVPSLHQRSRNDLRMRFFSRLFPNVEQLACAILSAHWFSVKLVLACLNTNFAFVLYQQKV